MASASPNVGSLFAAGTTVGAYPRSNWVSHERPPTGTPKGSATATATVSSAGVAAFTGLTADTHYYVTDSTGSRYVNISTYDSVPAAQQDSTSSGSGVILPFQANHAYAAGEAMISGGATYTRNSAGTSRATFDSTELALWSLLPAGTASITTQNLLNAGAALNAELHFPCASDGRTITGTDESVLGDAACPLAIRSFTLISSSGAVSADDSNYFTIELGRYRAGVYAAIASKTTKTVASGGEAISGKVPWTYDSITFDSTNCVLAVHDTLTVKYTFTGTIGSNSIVRPRFSARYEGV